MWAQSDLVNSSCDEHPLPGPGPLPGRPGGRCHQPLASFSPSAWSTPSIPAGWWMTVMWLHHEDSRENPVSSMPHTQRGAAGPRGRQAEQRAALPDATGRPHRFPTHDARQGVHAGASSYVVLMCLTVTVLGPELMHPDNLGACDGLPAPGGSPRDKRA